MDAAIGEELGQATKLRLVQRDVARNGMWSKPRSRPDADYAPSFFILLAIARLICAVGILTPRTSSATDSWISEVGERAIGRRQRMISSRECRAA